MSKIKLLHITSTRYGIGGVEKLLLDMSDKYDPERYDVSYCNLFCDKGGQGAFPTELRNRGLKAFEIAGNRASDVPGILYKLIKLFRLEGFDVIHLHMLQATIVGGIAALIGGKAKIVVTKHFTYPMIEGRSISRFLDVCVTKAADHVIAISGFVKKDMAKAGIPVEKISVIFNGIDIKAFDQQILEDRDLGASAGIHIVTVGSLTARKGHRYLIEAVGQLGSLQTQVVVLVVGEGPERESLESDIERAGVEASVRLVGFQKNVASILAKADLYVHPSIHEPFGIAILEAMAAGCCVIATSVDGVPEIVVDGETGLLVPERDTEALKNVIERMLEFPAERARMGENGRHRVEAEFVIEGTVRACQKIYDRIL